MNIKTAKNNIMEYNFTELEARWQQYWKANNTFHVEVDNSKPKFYVLDMFPYPSGAGLHVGHPLGYVASDIYTRFMRLKGYNVLHPMGFDAYGLPAEQYAIQTGQHPAITTDNNIKRYRQQLDKIGFAFDWDREVRTCDPDYYHWTQWAFIQMFKHWYNNKTDKAEPIDELIKELQTNGNKNIDAACSETPEISAEQWKAMSEKEQQEFLLHYRLAYLADTMVNWCPELGTVLANDEVVNGVSERGGHPVEQKVMRQWALRVTAYSQRLLDGLDRIDWTESLKEMQRNWIGRSEGAEVLFKVKNSDVEINIFTTRPDTIYGATFMVLAPESELVEQVTTKEYKKDVAKYVEETKLRTERERMMEVRKITGEFTGAYTINPFTEKPIPIWISDYVLAGYGTGAIMAVPAHDSRDYAFAKHFRIPIVQVVDGGDISEESYDAKDGKMMNSGIINGLHVKDAIPKIIDEIERRKLGKRKINYRMRDAIFSRQRYWGEPFPVYYKDEVPYTLDENDLPLRLPEVDAYLPTEEGEPPLGRAKNWQTADGYPLELSTMPGFAGSSAYYLRYMDPKNNNTLVSKEANAYWKDVDLYVGGTEHATGHLIYSRFWNKFLYDLGYVYKDEPFKKLINQGKIQGRSNLVYRVNNRKYAEHQLWSHLKESKLGCKFKRDYNLDHNIYSLCCEEKKLIIEVCNPKSAEKFFDEKFEPLQKRRFKLLVVTTEQIISHQQETLNYIKDILESNADIEHDFSEISSAYVPLFVSYNLLKDEYEATPIHVDINMVKDDVLDIDAFKKWRYEYENAVFVLEDGKYICGSAIEKMSKSLYNVVNPDDIIKQYGADTLRMYEMFLGPIEQDKPWDTNGIEGVHKFLRKTWRLFFDDKNQFFISDESPTKDELKALHKTIKKVQDDIQRFSFNTAVSAFMICVNELSDLKCNKRHILEQLIILLSPFAPHLCEELWHKMDFQGSIANAQYPVFNSEYLIESTCVYPVAFNGKRRFEIELPLDMSQEEIKNKALSAEKAQKWLAGKTPKKVIVVPKRMINVVI